MRVEGVEECMPAKLVGLMVGAWGHNPPWGHILGKPGRLGY